MKDMLIWFSWNSVAEALDTSNKWVADNIGNDEILVAHVIDTGFKVLNRFQSSKPVSKF